MPDKVPYLNFSILDYLADKTVITAANFKKKHQDVEVAWAKSVKVVCLC